MFDFKEARSTCTAMVVAPGGGFLGKVPPNLHQCWVPKHVLSLKLHPKDINAGFISRKSCSPQLFHMQLGTKSSL